MEVRCNESANGMKLAPSSSSSSSCFITDLPTPILMEILCRLPIKTLTACKSVCKSWLHLSRDPHFTQLHQAKAPIEVCFQLLDENKLKLHMSNFHCFSNFDPLDVKLNTLFEIPKFKVKPNNALNFKAGTGYFKFSNSCNGLFCYHSGIFDRFTVVWNPCTSEFITLPSPATSSNCCRYGFGFSRKTNKYKLLRVVSQTIGDPLGKNAVTEICTIEKGCSWNALGPCPSYVWKVINYSSRSCTVPTFLHGTLHWPVSRNNTDNDILTFDFEDDRFGRVPLPPSIGKIDIRLCQVGELSGCLFITECRNEGMNIWLMKEYGVQDSWTKVYSLPWGVNGQWLYQNCLLPVTCLDNSEILLLAYCEFMSTLVFSHNPDQEGFRLVSSSHHPLRVIAYKPSLISLKGSMLGYKVHANKLKHRERSTSSVLSNVSAMMEYTIKQIKTMKWWWKSKDEKAKAKQLNASSSNNKTNSWKRD